MLALASAGHSAASEPAATGSIGAWALSTAAYATPSPEGTLLPFWDAWLLRPLGLAGQPGPGLDQQATSPTPGAYDGDAARSAEAAGQAPDRNQNPDQNPDQKPGQIPPPQAAEPPAVQPALLKPTAKAWLYISKKSQRIYLKDLAPAGKATDHAGQTPATGTETGPTASAAPAGAKPDATLASWPVSTARYSLSTPVGRFRIVSQVPDPPYSGRHGYYKPKDPRNPLGSRWMGLNVGHFRTGVPIGIHGTNEPDKIGQAVSDGCVRLRNSDVEVLFKLARIGMPVVISNE